MPATMLTYRCPHCGTPVTLEPHASSELVTCPSEACSKPFRAEAPSVEPEAGSPPISNEGDEEQVSNQERRQVRPAQPARPAESPPPPARLAQEREEEVMKLHIDVFRRYPFRIAGYSILIVIGLIAIIAAMIQWNWFFIGVGAVLAGFAAFRLGAWWLLLRSTTVTLTNQRCILETGLYNREKAEVQLADITDIQVHQSTLTKMFNVGDIVLSADNGERRQFVLMAIPSPEEVAERFRQRRQASSSPAERG